MVKVIYKRLDSSETDENKNMILVFSGETADKLKYELKIKGNSESIGDFTKEMRIDFFGQQLDLMLSNKQSTIGDFK